MRGKNKFKLKDSSKAGEEKSLDHHRAEVETARRHVSRRERANTRDEVHALALARTHSAHFTAPDRAGRDR